MDKTTFESATVYSLKKSVEIATGAVVSKQFVKTKGGNITFFAFDKGQGLSEHTAPFDAVVQVVEGKAEVSIGGKPHLVAEGEMILMPANVPHALHAVEAFKMCLTMIRDKEV